MSPLHFGSELEACRFNVDRKLFKMRELRGAGIVTVELVPTAIMDQSGRHLYLDSFAPPV